ncbi:MAG: SCO family protein [Chitinophagales bacterium]|nr:SCO family protein [Chitinophagaceae bacterium]MCB9065909.1 SCO family protein [Chitinophagales bacterium]
MDSQALKTVLRLGVTVLISCLLGACNKQEAELPYYNSPDLTPVWEQGSGKHRIADFAFTDQNGKTVDNNTYNGKIYVANFFFTSCPGICPKMKDNMQKVAKAFASNNNVAFLSHSVTPYADSVSVLHDYAAIHNINAKQWHLVTGDKGEIYKLARQSYFAEDEIGFNADSTEFLHTERFVLIDKERHIRGVYNGTVDLETDRLIEDINLLLKEE